MMNDGVQVVLVPGLGLFWLLRMEWEWATLTKKLTNCPPPSPSPAVFPNTNGQPPTRSHCSHYGRP